MTTVRVYSTVAIATDMSCEQGRCSAYSEDLRWRIVWQKLALGLDNKSIASNLCIDPSTVHRIAIYRFNIEGGYAALYNLWNS